jgi:hypothetical protein
MTAKLKVFKRIRAAKAASKGLPILRVGVGRGALFIVGFNDMEDAKRTEITVLAPNGWIAGHINMRHLDRLGNGNFAVATCPYNDVRAFPEG